MKIAIAEKPWSISQRQLQTWNVQNIEKMLSLFNHVCSGQFYMVDSFSKKIIVDSNHTNILCGYSKELLNEEGFAFYNRILSKEEALWAEQMNSAAHEIFSMHSISKRTNLVAHYDLEVISKSGEKFVIHHKVLPYKLCKNGNLWLRLCHATISSSTRMKNKAIFINTETRERYDFINGKFILSKSPGLSLQEIQILKLLIKGMPDKQISSLCNDMPVSTFKTKKKQLFKKLETNNAASAIHRAHLLGLI